MTERQDKIGDTEVIQDFLVRGGSIPMDLPIGAINPSAISSLIEQNGGQVGWAMVIGTDGIAQWQPVSVLIPPGTVTELNDLTDVQLAGLATSQALIFTGAFWTNTTIVFSIIGGTAAKAQLPTSVAYEDEANIFTQPISVDVINEQTTDAGVTIDGVLLKDGEVELPKKALRLDDTGVTPKLLYLGKGAPGIVDSAALWSIQKITFNAQGDAEILWADGDSDEDNIWNNRLSLSYS